MTKSSNKRKGRTNGLNPFRPGAGHMPPHLAGRGAEKEEFLKLLEQRDITDNMILTGLRGVGKTVFLEILKPLALNGGWMWAGADLSESTSITEDRIAQRLLADLSLVTSSLVISKEEIASPIFSVAPEQKEYKLEHHLLKQYYDKTPGLVTDKVKAVFELAWSVLKKTGKRGIVFAYDEAQTMTDHAKENEYPLASLLEVFQSIQRKGVPFLLVLTGLPTLFARLVESRTYAERMFHTVFLDQLSDQDSREAILKPLEDSDISMSNESVETIIDVSGGYPYFIQFICREVFDLFRVGQESVPVNEIIMKLDADFFAGRWQRLTDRQRELLVAAARLPNSESEFTVQDITEKSKEIGKPFTASHANQMLASLGDKGLVFKNRHGKYLFAVPLLSRFILRQEEG